MSFHEYQAVRIRALVRGEGEYDLAGSNERAPRIGDTGTIVHISGDAATGLAYTVEKSNPDGTCIWLADFLEQELDAAEAEHPSADDLARWRSTGSNSSRRENIARSDDGSSWLLAVAGGVIAIAAVALLLAITAAGAYGLYLYSPPASALGAGLRAALLMGAFAVVGGSLSGQNFEETLVTVALLGILFFALGSTVWLVVAS